MSSYKQYKTMTPNELADRIKRGEKWMVGQTDAPHPPKTLRDEFAMAAMQGLLSNPTFDAKPEDVADIAYDHADAMLRERMK